MTILTTTAYLALAAALQGGSPSWRSQGSTAWEHLGTDANLAGDVDGDGEPDLLVLARGTPPVTGVNGIGKAELYFGSPSGFPTVPDWTVRGGLNQSDPLDWRAAGAGDLNGDGYADVVLGTSGGSGGSPIKGAVYVFYGGPLGPNGGLDATVYDADWTARGTTVAYGSLGRELLGPGDVDGDGFDDLLLAAPVHKGLVTVDVLEGAVCLFRGSAAGLTPGISVAAGDDADWIVESDVPFAQFGTRLHALGDFDQDGFADFVVTGLRGVGEASDTGRHWVFRGGPSGPAAGLAGAFATIGGGDVGFPMGTDLAAGDFDRDGFVDLVVGFPNVSYSGLEPLELHLGSAAGFVRSTWRLTGAWPPEGAGTELEAGDFDGDGRLDLAVLSTTYKVAAGNAPGRVRVFRGQPGGPQDPLERVASWEQALSTDFFGKTAFLRTVARGGPGAPAALLIAEPDARVAGLQSAGQVTLFEEPAPTLEACPLARPDWVRVGQPGERIGFYATAGDFDGDGFDDALLGRRSPLPSQPHLELYLGSAAGLAATPAWTHRSTHVAAQFGVEPVGVGDVNGDGFDDALVLLKGRGYVPGEPLGRRAAFVFHGGPGGLGAPAWTATTRIAGPTQFAWHGDVVGDLNGDGFDDVAIGAPGHEQLPPGFHDPYDVPGAVYVWYGSAAGVNGGVPGTEGNAAWSATHDDSRSYLGTRVRRAGDVDGDGFADLIVGAPHLHVGNLGNAGALYVWRGSSAGVNGGVPGTPANAWQTLTGAEGGNTLGLSFDVGADLSGDGLPELATISKQGTVFGVDVRVATATGFQLLPAARLTRADRQGFGNGFALIPDFDGDGVGDLVVGSPSATGAAVMDGRIDLFRGAGSAAAGLVAPAAVWRTAGFAPHANLGFGRLLVHGDFDGDGRADLLAGSPWYDQVLGDERGRFCAWYGTPRPQFAIGATTLAAGGPIEVGHLGWDANARTLLVAQPSGGGPIVRVARGLTDADGCWMSAPTLPPAVGVGAWEFWSVVLDPRVGWRGSPRVPAVVQ